MTINQVSHTNSSKSPFPQNFLWGAATASHQVEGSTLNDWSEWEQKNATRLAEESEAAFHWNPHWQKFKDEATDPRNYISGVATDHWNRYQEDFDIMKSLGFSAYRFSIEWSRIEPEKGTFNTEALDHYRKMVLALQERGITPFVTLWHWTLPLWLRDEGGVLAKKFPEYFARYAEKVLEVIGGDIQFVVTLNEPEVMASHVYQLGAWPPQEKGLFKFLRANLRLVSAHKKAYQVLKKKFPHLQIGIAKHNVYFEVAKPSLWNKLLKFLADYTWNHWWLNRIKNHQDFIGLNHYNRSRIDGWYNRNPNTIQTDFGWDYVPESLTQALVELIPYHKPIYVTENGLADAEDALRQDFIPRAIHALEEALKKGADVRGYMYWSLLDNFEWDKGYWLKFGLISVDKNTLARTVRPSAQLYANLIQQSRGIE